MVRVAPVTASVNVLKLVIGPLKPARNWLSTGVQCVITFAGELLGLTICTESIAVHPEPSRTPPATMFVVRKLVMVVVVVITVGTSNDQLAPKNVSL
jgi:hypothetical protein